LARRPTSWTPPDPQSMTLRWVFVGAGFFWLAMLLGLTAADYLTRYSYAPT